MTELHHFAVYEAATGKVLRVGRGTSPRIAEVQRLGEGEAVYVGQIDPATQYLPGGVVTEKEPEQPLILPRHVKAWAGRILTYTDWYVTRQQEGGAEAPAEILAYRQAVRDASGAIEAMDPIPADYRDPKYWPTQP